MDRGAELYLRYLAGDDDALGELIAEYKDGLIFYLHTFTHDLNTAEEQTEETFVRLAVRRPVFVPKAKFKTWLYTIARNIALDWVRRSAGRKTLALDDIGEVTDEEAGLEQEFLRQERNAAVRRALKNLNCNYAQVLYLAYFEGFSNMQTGKIMRKSRRQVENLLYQAKKALKAELDREAMQYEEC